ncbi:MAG: fatty acid desaturase [Planctomycetota bacterium]|nr:fatty acid desaturase [Planctomycetota bacterium]
MPKHEQETLSVNGSGVAFAPDPLPLALSLEAPPLPDEPLQRPGIAAQAGSLIVIVVPFLGLIAAVILLWHAPFSWLNLPLFFGGYAITTIGVTVGYHRLFTHKSFKAKPAVAATLGVLGSMAIEGSILEWVATHRRHHQHTDRENDPHSPYTHGEGFVGMLRGMVHSHFGWFFSKRPSPEVMAKYVPDLMADPVVSFVSRWFVPLAIIGQLVPAAIGFAVTQSWMGALMAWIWGGLLRVFFVHHVTWSVNSVCHLWGSRPFRTHDESRNNFIMGILAFGEGWHNTHHAFPASARHGLSWRELDFSYWVIRLLAWTGLVWDVKVPAADRIESKRRHAGIPAKFGRRSSHSDRNAPPSATVATVETKPPAAVHGQ